MKFITQSGQFSFKILNAQLLLILLLFLSCKLSAQINNSYFKVTRSTVQSWSGGAYGSGSGIYYNFQLKFNKSAVISFDSLWIDSVFKHFYNRANITLKQLPVKKGDSVVLSTDFYFPGEREMLPVIKEPVKKPSPCKDCKMNPIIVFSIAGKVYYYEVKNLTGLEPINYP
jgi:hypothetical protein